MYIYLTAVVKAKPAFRKEVLAVLENMVRETGKERGCIQYDLHQGIDDKDVFVFYEIWENEKELEKHNSQPYIEAFIGLAGEKLEDDIVVYRTEKI